VTVNSMAAMAPARAWTRRSPNRSAGAFLPPSVAEGLLRREPNREPNQRQRAEYRLTPKGLDLYPVLAALNEWGSAYYADPQGSPLAFRHRDCGAEVTVVLRCADEHDIRQPRDVLPAPGPGARRLPKPSGQSVDR